jgi:hypothetical protein
MLSRILRARALPSPSLRALAPRARAIHTSRVSASAGLSVHKYDENNKEDTPFEWTEESLKQIEWYNIVINMIIIIVIKAILIQIIASSSA